MVCVYRQAFLVLPKISAMAPGFKDKIFRLKADEGLILFTTLLHTIWSAISSKPQTELDSFVCGYFSLLRSVFFLNLAT